MSKNPLKSHVAHHRFFYLAGLAGAVAWVAAARIAPAYTVSVAGDVFFGVYDAAIIALGMSVTSAQLRAKAEEGDEGVTFIILLALGAICFSLFSIFALLNGGMADPLHLVLAVASAPLGWLMLHMIAAFHYAHRYYSGDQGGLNFPDCGKPGAIEFLYYSFVVGMTAQVSDVQVTSRIMRRITMVHSIVSFFYNTVLIALAVNVAVALAVR